MAITAGQKQIVRVPVAIGAAYNGDFTLKLEPTGDLKVPATISLKEDDKDFNVEITAGFTKGMFSVRVTPDVGLARDIKVIVK